MRLGLLVVVLVCSGCASTGSFLSRAKAIVKTPSATVEQSGSVATPAQTTVTTTKTEAPIPPGSTITITTPSTTASPVPVLSTTTTTEHIVAPTSFTPPPPPTPVQVVDAQMKIWFWLGLIVGVSAAIFGLVRGWNLVMWGGVAVAGACAFGIFVQQAPWLFAIIGAGVALKFAGPYIWHTQVKPLSTPSTDVQ